MAGRLRSFTRKFVIVTHIVIAVLFLLSCLAPFLPPQNWWYISLLAFGFPFLLLLMILFLFFWLFRHSAFFLVSLIPMLIGWKSISVFFAVNFNSGFEYDKEPGNLRVVSWNVARFVELKRNNNKGSQTRLRMFDFLRQQNADVLCLQEFFSSDNPEYYNNLKHTINELGYPYHYYSREDDGKDHYIGSAIFSRYPIVDSGIVFYKRPSLPEALIYADIKTPHNTIRIFTSHLQSFQFRPADYKRIERIKEPEPDEELIQDSRTILSKLKWGLIYRSMQAETVKAKLSESRHPKLFCGDLNDIPNSYTYRTVRGKMQDAFLKKGLGIGRTFRSISPTLRIDYIFADPEFEVRQFNRILKDYSDHNLILADLRLR